MINVLLICLLAISLANSVGVNFCCGEDETLVVKRINPGKRVAECLGGGEVSSLEGKQVWVGGEEEGELKSLKLLEVRRIMFHDSY